MEIPNFTPYENEFSHEISQIKYLHKFAIIIRSQILNLKEIIEREWKNNENLSNSTLPIITNFFHKTANFSKESSGLFEILNNGISIIKEFSITNPEEKVDSSFIENVETKLNKDLLKIYEKFKNVQTQIKELNALIVEKKKKVAIESERIEKVEVVKEEKNVSNPYEVSKGEKIDNKITEMTKQYENASPEITSLNKKVDEKPEEFNNIMNETFETVIPILISFNIKIKQLFCFICHYKLEVLERVRASVEKYIDNFANAKILLKDEVETKYSIEVKKIDCSPLENIKLMYSNIYSDQTIFPDSSTIVIISADPYATSNSLAAEFLLMINHLLNYLNNFRYFVYTRKKILKTFLEFHIKINNLINYNKVEIGKNSMIIKAINEEESYFIKENLMIENTKYAYNSSLWEIFNNNYISLINSLSNLNNFNALKFHPYMKKINSEYKEELHQWKLLRKKFETELLSLKRSISKHHTERERLTNLILRRAKACSDASCVKMFKNEEEIKINIIKQLVYDNKSKILDCLDSCINLSNTIRANESSRLEVFMNYLKVLLEEKANIVSSQIKFYEYENNLAHNINLYDELRTTAEPLLLKFNIKKTLFDNIYKIISQKTNEDFLEKEVQVNLIREDREIKGEEALPSLVSIPSENFLRTDSYTGPSVKEMDSKDLNDNSSSYSDTSDLDLVDFRKIEIKTEEESNASLMEMKKTELLQSKTLKSHKYSNIFDMDLDEEYLANFNCAYRSNILVQGKIYITSKKLVFSSWFNAETLQGGTKVVIPLDEILSVKKEKYMKIFNNGIQFSTKKINKISFVSFVTRDKCYDFIEELLSKKEKEGQIEIMKEEHKEEEIEDENDSEIGATEIKLKGKVNKEDKINQDNLTLNSYRESILNETNFIEKLKNIELQKIQKLEKKYYNLNPNFYKTKIFENETVGELPANFVYSIAFNKDFKTPELGDSNLNFLENIFNKRNDKDAKYKEGDNTQDIPEYLIDYKQFINLLTEVNKEKLVVFLNQLESEMPSTFTFEYSFTHPMKKRMLFPKPVSVRNSYMVHFVSPQLIFINMQTYTKGVPYSNNFHSELLYKIESKVYYKRRFNFKNVVSIYFTLVFDKPVFMKGFIEKEGTKEAVTDIKAMTVPCLKLCMQQRKHIFRKELDELLQINFSKVTESEDYLNYVKNKEISAPFEKEEFYETIPTTEPGEEITEEEKPIEMIEEKIEEVKSHVKSALSLKEKLFNVFASIHRLKNIITTILLILLLKNLWEEFSNFNTDKLLNTILLFLVIYLVNRK